MEPALYIWLALATLLSMASGQTITPTNWTSGNEEQQSDNAIGISFSRGDKMVSLGPVLALTNSASRNLPPTGLSGPVFVLNASNQLKVTSSNIALISCDIYPGNIQVDNLFGVAEKTNVTGIVLYSQKADWCDLQDFPGTFPWIYSTKSREEAGSLLGAASTTDTEHDGPVYATIGSYLRKVNGTAPSDGGNDGSSSNNNHQNSNMNPLGPSPSTAVAMIILYSITGIITALFLVIIITGALRAHRHPERYGPRNITGRPRQSRARGLARAIVETLPIVKVGEREEPKPTDVELADNLSNREETTERNAAADTTRSEADPPSQARQSVEGGIAAAVNANPQSSVAQNPDNKGCSICTEDFEPGQDQRVLPCDHRFHPECIDPWLLNVSGTCPLCRIDLRPETSQTSESQEVDENGNPVLREGEMDPGMAPPLGASETAGDRQQRMSVRRSIVIGLMGVARPERMTRDERVRALRALRSQRIVRERAGQQGGVGEPSEEESSRRARLRRAFGIRTRRTGQTEEQAQPDSDASPSDPGRRGTFGG